MTSMQPLLFPYRMRDVTLANRLVMAPMTRSRARNPGLLPTDLHSEYYTQRASAGLIISEGIWISRTAVGWPSVPGLFTDQQIARWREVTDAVHQAGGVIFAQLWHTGSASHPDFLGGRTPLAPSAVNPRLMLRASGGRRPTVQPQMMTVRDIRQTISDYATASRNAMAAGFDGVQLQAGYNYLISQFLSPRTNLRKDLYGGSIQNRARFLFDVIEAIGERVDLRRVGVKAGPIRAETGDFVAGPATREEGEHVLERLNDYALSHLLLTVTTAAPAGRPSQPEQSEGALRHFRRIYRGTIIADAAFDQRLGNEMVRQDLADLVAYGRAFIANPDLPARFAFNSPLAEAKPALLYAPGAAGYTDYPSLRVSQLARGAA